MVSEWELALDDAGLHAARALDRYEALVAKVPELAKLEEEVERVTLSEDQAGLVELVKKRDKALEAHPRIWAARERWRVLLQLVETIETRAKGTQTPDAYLLAFVNTLGEDGNKALDTRQGGR